MSYQRVFYNILKKNTNFVREKQPLCCVLQVSRLSEVIAIRYLPIDYARASVAATDIKHPVAVHRALRPPVGRTDGINLLNAG